MRTATAADASPPPSTSVASRATSVPQPIAATSRAMPASERQCARFGVSSRCSTVSPSRSASGVPGTASSGSSRIPSCSALIPSSFSEQTIPSELHAADLRGLEDDRPPLGRVGVDELRAGERERHLHAGQADGDVRRAGDDLDAAAAAVGDRRERQPVGVRVLAHRGDLADEDPLAVPVGADALDRADLDPGGGQALEQLLERDLERHELGEPAQRHAHHQHPRKCIIPSNPPAPL